MLLWRIVQSPGKDWIPIGIKPLRIIEPVTEGEVVQVIRVSADWGNNVRPEVNGVDVENTHGRFFQVTENGAVAVGESCRKPYKDSAFILFSVECSIAISKDTIAWATRIVINRQTSSEAKNFSRETSFS